jgi:hypothetical protein
MSLDLSISVEGIARATQDLDRAARRIARPSSGVASEDVVQLGGAPPTPVDYATEMVNILRARTAVRANYRAAEATIDLMDEAIRLGGR